jgi:hypothetical protein
MKITPSNANLKSWSKQVPLRGDLLFFRRATRKLATRTSAPVLTAQEARAQALDIWKLSDRSWYGYSLNKATYAVFLPRGGVEVLDASLINQLGAEQARLGVPSLVRSELLSRSLKSCFREVGKFRWITSQAFWALNRSERIEVMNAWMIQNKIHFYESVALNKVPPQPLALLKAAKLSKLLNKYAKTSGPNCLAATAAAITRNPKFAQQWLHWGPLETLLRSRRFIACASSKPSPGDVLVFFRQGEAVHSAFYIGSGLYFEKPGQDFYEPYRIEHFAAWKKEWVGCSLTVYRQVRAPTRTERAHK